MAGAGMAYRSFVYGGDYNPRTGKVFGASSVMPNSGTIATPSGTVIRRGGFGSGRSGGFSLSG